MRKILGFQADNYLNKYLLLYMKSTLSLRRMASQINVPIISINTNDSSIFTSSLLLRVSETINNVPTSEKFWDFKQKLHVLLTVYELHNFQFASCSNIQKAKTKPLVGERTQKGWRKFVDTEGDANTVRNHYKRPGRLCFSLFPLCTCKSVPPLLLLIVL